MKKLIAVFLSLIILLISLSGCAEKRPEGADESFYSLLSAEPVTLDPQICTDSSGLTLINAVFEGLVRLNEEGKAVPGVAESWESDSANTVFTFTLRENAVWYGTGVDEDIPVTAHDFVFAFRRAVDPATSSPLASQLFCIKNAREIYNGTLPAESLGVSASGDRTLIVTLEYSCPSFPEMTASSVFMPCNEEFFNTTNGKYGISNNTLLTNGPFRFSGYYAWEPYSHVELSRSDSYKGDTEVWPASIYYYIGDAEINLSDPVSLLQNQSLQASPLTQEQAKKAQSEGLSVISVEKATCGLVFNMKDKTMQNEAIRKAFLGSIDREFLLQKLPQNTTAADDILSSNIHFMGSSYRSQTESELYFKADPAAAEAAENIPSVSVLCENSEETKLLVNQLIICWNEALGSYFNIEPVSSSELSSRVASGDYQIALCEISPSSDSPLGILEKFASYSSSNPAGLSDPTYDAYLNEAYSLSGVSACLSAEKYLNDRAVFYPIYYTYSYYGTAPGVSGIQLLPYHAGADFTAALLIEEN